MTKRLAKTIIMVSIFILFSTMLLFPGCIDDRPVHPDQKRLEGSWIETEDEDKGVIFTRDQEMIRFRVSGYTDEPPSGHPYEIVEDNLLSVDGDHGITFEMEYRFEGDDTLILECDEDSVHYVTEYYRSDIDYESKI